MIETLTSDLASKNVLILLDNCEHLVAACADLASRVLRSAASVRLLATSREAFGVAGERVVPVLELSDEEALQLFTERAQLSNPRFQLTDKNRQVTTQVCHRLDGIPLAIELAAARTKLMSVEQLFQRLDHRFSVLGGGGRSMQARQQTLKATADWSYDLLEADEKTAFDMLSVCVGGFSLEAADAICGEGMDALTAVSRLVDKSMVVAGEIDQGEPRYRILETLREYGLERLGATPHEALAHERHLDYYVELAEKANATGAHGLMASTLELELGNFLAAMEECETAPPSVGVRLVVALAPCWPMRGQVSVGRAWSERMVARSGPDQPRLAWVYHELGWLAFFTDDLEAARSHFERSVRLAHDAGDLSTAGRALNALATIDLSRDELDSARLRCERALVDLAAVGDVAGQAQALHYLGWVAFFKGEYPLSYQHFQQTLEMRRRDAEPDELSRALGAGVWAAIKTGHVDDAGADLLEALQLQLSIVNVSVLRIAFLATGVLLWELGEPRQALVMSAVSGAINRATGGSQALSSWVRWQTTWKEPALEIVGQEEGAAATAEGELLSPAAAIQIGIDWVRAARAKVKP